MIIREAEFRDMKAIMILIALFFDESLKNFVKTYDFTNIQHLAAEFIKADDKLILVAESDGNVIAILIAHLEPWIFDFTKLVACENMWYVREDFRKGTLGMKLLKGYEEWAKSKNANVMMMARMNGLYPKLHHVYEGLGFNEMEVHYIKEI